jgi:hypothetical protein
MRRSGLSLLVALAAAVPAVRAADGSPAELKTLRVLLVLDTSSNLAQSIKHDSENMRIVLEEHIPEGRRKIDVIDGKRVTRENILRYYRDLKTGPDEVLLFFYSGHGRIDPKLGQCLEPQMGKTPLVPRGDVRKAMEGKGAGLVILLTDCCSTRIAAKPGVATRQTITDVKLHPVLRSLFFLHRGTVDVTAAEDGTGSWGDDEHGGVFTCALVSLLEGDLKKLNKEQGGVLSWKEFFPQLSRETEKQFRDLATRARANRETVDQKTQRPRSFALPDPPVSRKTYAVVSLRNGSGRAVHFRYRWAGDKEWTDDSLPEKGMKSYDRVVDDGGKLPAFEIEAVGEAGKGMLEAAKWSGTGRPKYEDGKEYDVSAKPEK